MKEYINYVDAFLKIPETGLDAFEQYLKDANADGRRRQTDVEFGFGDEDRGRDADMTRLASLVNPTSPLLNAKTSAGKNILHLVGEYKLDMGRHFTAIAKMKPSLLEERETEYGFTPLFSFVNSGGSKLVEYMLSVVETNLPGYCRGGDDGAIFPMRKTLLSQKDGAGRGLAFWCAGHDATTGIGLLKDYGVDIWEEPEPGVNILKTASAKFMIALNQKLEPWSEKYSPLAIAKESLDRIVDEYVEDFGKEELIALVRSDPKSYAPVMGHCFDEANTPSLLLPVEEVVQLLKNETYFKSDTIAAHAATAVLQEWMYPEAAAELYYALLDKERMGARAADATRFFGKEEHFHIHSNHTQQDDQVSFIRGLHEHCQLSADDLHLNEYLAIIIIMADSTASRRASANLVEAFLDIGADALTTAKEKTIADIAIAKEDMACANVIKAAIEKELRTPPNATRAAALAQENKKLTSFMLENADPWARRHRSETKPERGM